MGAAPKQPPSAARVAQSFVNVYYRVAEKLPERIVELYGPDSEIHHGDGLDATGPAIAHVARKLPLSGAATTVNKVAAQQTGASAYLVVVHGQSTKQAKTFSFTQTFVLEKQRDSHDVHFYCRNDIFTSLTDAPQPSQTVSSEPEPVVAETLTDTTPATPSEPPKPSSPPPALPDTQQVEQLPTEVAQITSVDPDTLPPANGIMPHNQSEPQTQPSPESIIPATSDRAPPAPALVESVDTSDIDLAPQENLVVSFPNGDSTKEHKSPMSAARSVPLTKKTWASIVSSKDDVEDSTPVVSVTEQTPVVVPELVKQLPEPVPAEVEQKPITQSNTRQENVQSANRAPHQHSGHQHSGHPYRGYPRVFGPSAVVQLSILGDNFLQDIRGLTNSLREEFSTYGHKLRHVEVKMAKGIAFIEYDTMDGVRAAVSAWANGARDVGPFQGIALNVSEKRPSYGGRRPGSMRGGRGSARGARRHRASFAPIS
ncbi:unnamed protein product [Agarophyton chilense]|eukprot:gb/GEZJ01005250.1/.p1 GENE.gb/GEZJ01005250.1/~~gb/GEZJ01005250.1/.p1  ORF type:complete len:514 (+),score=59.23 gb/GEZJ01005250.1/:92-1543(+)